MASETSNDESLTLLPLPSSSDATVEIPKYITLEYYTAVGTGDAQTWI